MPKAKELGLTKYLQQEESARRKAAKSEAKQVRKQEKREHKLEKIEYRTELTKSKTKLKRARKAHSRVNKGTILGTGLRKRKQSKTLKSTSRIRLF